MMPHNTVLELVYILTGVALSYTFVGIHKVIVNFFKGDKVFVPFFLMCVFLPPIIWQHTYEVSFQMDNLFEKYKLQSNELKHMFGVISICELVSWSVLFGIIVTVFPIREKIKYSITSRKWREHVKTNRRIFFFLCFQYILTVFLSNWILEMEEQPTVINSSRYVMMYACAIAFILNFEVKGKTVEYNLRLVYPRFFFKRGTISMKVEKKPFCFYKEKFKKKGEAREKRKRFYNSLDAVTIAFLILGFITISLSRNL